MSEKAFWRLGVRDDLEKAYAFFYAMRNETDPPFSTYPQGLRRTTELFLEEGRLLLAVCGDEIVGLIGYFHGVPKIRDDGLFDYLNPEIAYIYSCVIAPEHRGLLSLEMVPFLGTQINADGHTEVRFKAYKENNDRVNRGYSRFAKVLAEETNTQGYLCNLYTADPVGWKKLKVPAR